MDDKNVKVVVEKLKNGKVNLDVSCDHCGKPLTISTPHGIFCEDRCGEKRALGIEKKLERLLDILCDDDEDDPARMVKNMKRLQKFKF